MNKECHFSEYQARLDEAAQVRMDWIRLTPEAEQHFPSHGWITGHTGIKHLRLPIMRLYQWGQPTYDRIEERGQGGFWLQSRSPSRTLRQLAVGLRDLHAEIRKILPIAEEDWYEHKPSDGRDDALTQLKEGYERIEISLIATFILLRRLADDLIFTSRPFLFENLKSAPWNLKDAIKMFRDDKLDGVKPICNIDMLSDTLQNYTAWHDQLRKKDGIRDILVHNAHILQVNAQATQDPGEVEKNWKITALLLCHKQEIPGGLRVIDLFTSLMDCIAGACRFMDRLYCCVSPLDSYQYRDILFLTGSDNDIVAFWPSITGTKTEFPLMS